MAPDRVGGVGGHLSAVGGFMICVGLFKIFISVLEWVRNVFKKKKESKNSACINPTQTHPDSGPI